MEQKVDKRFSDMFLIPPPKGKGMLNSRVSELKEVEASQGKLSLRRRIVAAFQSSKPIRESVSEPPHRLRADGEQKTRLSNLRSALESMSSPDVEEIRGRLRRTGMTTSTCPSPARTPSPGLMEHSLGSRSTQQADTERPQSFLYAEPVPQSSITSRPPTTATRPTFQRSATSPRRGLRSQSPATSTRSSTSRFSFRSSKSRSRSRASTSRFSLSRRFSVRHDDDTASIRSTVTVHPPPSLAAHLSSLLQKRPQHGKTNSTGHDSKYCSSVSSLASLKTSETSPRTSASLSPVASPPKVVTDVEFAELERIARRVERRLSQQFAQCQQLSLNLVRLSQRKMQSLRRTDAILANTQCPPRCGNKDMRYAILHTKDKIRFIFTKKANVLQKTTLASAAINEALRRAKKDASDGTYAVDVDPFQRMATMLKENVTRQAELDDDLKYLLGKLSSDRSFQIHLRDRQEMGNFRLFIDGRMRQMKKNYSHITALNERIERSGICTDSV